MPTKTSSKPTGNWYTRLRDRLPIRGRWLVLFVAVVLAGLGVERLYRTVQTQLAGLPRYRLTAESIVVTAPPPWIRSDVKAEVLRDSNLLSDVSILGEPRQVHTRLVDAFQLHPWIERVERVELVSPAGAQISLTYRRPIAAVEVQRGNVTDLHLVDRQAVRLPDTDLTEAEKLYLPRIASVQGSVLVGEPWTDPRVVGAVQLAVSLAEKWETLHLVDIIPSNYPEIRRSQKYYIYQLRASYGTQILWGAAPGMAPPDEDSVEAKLARLQDYIAEHGPLNSTFTPQSIEIRDRLVIRERTAKKGDDNQEATAR